MASSLLLNVCLALLPILKGHAASCDGPSFTFTSWKDDGALDGCQTYNGDIVVDDGAPTVLRLNELQNITGSLVITHAMQFVKLEAQSLSVIGGDLKLFALPDFTALDLSALHQVNNIHMSLLPSLTQDIYFQTAFAANAVYINNTGLGALSLPVSSTKEVVDVRENYFLRSLNLSQIKDAPKGITVLLNSEGLDLDLGSLETGSDMYLKGIASINAPNLRDLHDGVYVDGIFQLDSSPLTNLSLPKLSRSGSLSVIGCPDLLYVNAPLLGQTTYSGVEFALNPKLRSIELPELRSLKGEGTYMDLDGNFTRISMPVLEQIEGNVWITTTYDVPSVCDDSNRVNKDGNIAGSYNCTIGKLNPFGSTPAQPAPSNRPKGSGTTLGGGAIAGIAVGGAVVIALMSLVCCYKCCWQKRRPKRTEPTGDVQPPSGETDAQTTVAPPSYAAVLEDDHIRRAPQAEDQLQDVSEKKTVLSSEQSGDLYLGDKQVIEVRGEMV